ncbi:MAG: DUF3429 domain-containing protein, partial [Burkholderiales bacterium]|nr:DUF3429 domain-containing protein [Burkholderiales bacterium]
MTPHQAPVPATPLWIGAGSLLPFVLLAGALFIVPEAYRPMLHEWLRSWSAVVLTFVGALHWGIAMLHRDMRERERNTAMAWSFVPAVVAWICLLLPQRTGLLLIGAMFVVHFSMDLALAKRFSIADWYL